VEFETCPNTMWGRANMAAMIFLLGWLYVFSRAEGTCFLTYKINKENNNKTKSLLNNA